MLDHDVYSAITQNIARFVFRVGRADTLRDLFHPHATIAVGWNSGGIDGFIEVSCSAADVRAVRLPAPDPPNSDKTATVH